MNKILSIAICIYLATSITACTNSKTDDGSANQAGTESSLENPEAGQQATTDKPVNPDEAQAGFLDDQLPDNSLGAAAGKNEAAKDATKDALALPPDNGVSPNLGEAAASSTPPPSLSSETPVASDIGEKKEEPPKTETSIAGDIGEKKEESPKMEEAPKPKASLQKIKDVPFREGGQLLNTVYIARPKDDYKKISTMIYGSDSKAGDLKKANSGMKKVKPGQKVYYNSPKRPEDESKMMIYYEDAGVPAESYIAKDGDDLKKISKDLVGYSDGWKEIWATNSVESKGKVPAGTELKYWKGAAAEASLKPPMPETAGTMAPPKVADLPPPPMPEPKQANVPPVQPMPAAPPAPEARPADLPPPPLPEANMPPPPPMPEANMPPPPPPSEQVAKKPDMPPPPPAGMNANNKKPKPPVLAPEEGGLDQETMMYLAGAGIVAAALAGIIIIRKKKAQKAAAAAFDVQAG